MSEIQETYTLLTETDQLLSNIEAKIDSIESKQPQLEITLQTFQQIERLALRWLVLSRRLGLPDDTARAIDLIARLISSIRMLQLSMSLMYATNPLTAAIGVAGLVGGVMSFGDAFAGY